MAKTKALISFAVTAKLICAFVFAYVDCCFSHGAAQIDVYHTHSSSYCYLNDFLGLACDKSIQWAHRAVLVLFSLF